MSCSGSVPKTWKRSVVGVGDHPVVLHPGEVDPRLGRHVIVVLRGWDGEDLHVTRWVSISAMRLSTSNISGIGPRRSAPGSAGIAVLLLQQLRGDVGVGACIARRLSATMMWA